MKQIFQAKLMVEVQLFAVIFLLMISGCIAQQESKHIPLGKYINKNGNIILQSLPDNHLKLSLKLFLDSLQMNGYYLSDSKKLNKVCFLLDLEQGKDSIKAEYFLDEDGSLYMKYYKGRQGIENHIDEIDRFFPIENQVPEPINCSTIVLENLAEGDYYLLFENELSFGNNHCDTIFVKQAGLTKTGFTLDLRNINHINFQTNANKKIPHCENHATPGFCVEVHGFNQLPRDSINYILSDVLEGNIFMFSVYYHEWDK